MSAQTLPKYKVAINCLVYNHEPYLRECLEGFVMQQTDFPFVAIVHDDASTDHSADIIREYAAKYPDIIHPIYETENQYSKKNGSLTKIMDTAIAATGALYIALCEGDDYWTDPHKLQKQVDFLDTHPEYSLCFHKVNTLLQATGEITCESIVKDMQGESTIIELSAGNYIHTPSVVYRNLTKIKQDRAQFGASPAGDYIMWMLCAKYGKLYKLPDIMAVYRFGSGIWSVKSDFYRQVVWLSVLNQLRMMITNNKEALTVIDGQISTIQTMVLATQRESESRYRQLRSSYAYRLGKFLLRPFSFIRQHISK